MAEGQNKYNEKEVLAELRLIEAMKKQYKAGKDKDGKSLSTQQKKTLQQKYVHAEAKLRESYPNFDSSKTTSEHIKSVEKDIESKSAGGLKPKTDAVPVPVGMKKFNTSAGGTDKAGKTAEKPAQTKSSDNSTSNDKAAVKSESALKPEGDGSAEDKKAVKKTKEDRYSNKNNYNQSLSARDKRRVEREIRFAKDKGRSVRGMEFAIEGYKKKFPGINFSTNGAGNLSYKIDDSYVNKDLVNDKFKEARKEYNKSMEDGTLNEKEFLKKYPEVSIDSTFSDSLIPNSKFAPILEGYNNKVNDLIKKGDDEFIDESLKDLENDKIPLNEFAHQKDIPLAPKKESATDAEGKTSDKSITVGGSSKTKASKSSTTKDTETTQQYTKSTSALKEKSVKTDYKKDRITRPALRGFNFLRQKQSVDEQKQYIDDNSGTPVLRARTTSIAPIRDMPTEVKNQREAAIADIKSTYSGTDARLQEVSSQMAENRKTKERNALSAERSGHLLQERQRVDAERKANQIATIEAANDQKLRERQVQDFKRNSAVTAMEQKSKLDNEFSQSIVNELSANEEFDRAAIEKDRNTNMTIAKQEAEHAKETYEQLKYEYDSGAPGVTYDQYNDAKTAYANARQNYIDVLGTGGNVYQTARDAVAPVPITSTGGAVQGLNPKTVTPTEAAKKYEGYGLFDDYGNYTKIDPTKGWDIFNNYDGFSDISPEARAAMYGNAMHESASLGATQEVDNLSGRGGLGLIQWTGPRRIAMEKWAKDNNRSVNDYMANLDYLDHEMRLKENGHWTNGSFDEFKNIKDVKDATDYFMKNYERPADQSDVNLTHRYNQAKKYYKPNLPTAKLGGTLKLKPKF